MKDADKEEFREIMKLICELYTKNISQSMLRLYFEQLKGFSIEQVAKAISDHTSCKKNGSFFPKPADIIRKIEGEDLSPCEEFRQYLRSKGRKVNF